MHKILNAVSRSATIAGLVDRDDLLADIRGVPGDGEATIAPFLARSQPDSSYSRP
jgi:hypothetical protein